MVTHVWRNVPVLGSPSDVRMQPCESVVNHPFLCASYRSLKIFEVSTSDFGTVSMCIRFRAYVYKFLSMVTEGVVHGVHKVVIWSSFGVIWRHKVRAGISRFTKGELRLMEVASWRLGYTCSAVILLLLKNCV